MEIEFASVTSPRSADSGTRGRTRVAWCGSIRRMSVRRSLQAAMLVLVLLDTAQAALNFQAASRATFLLQRAEISNQQLDGYRSLSIGILEWLLLAGMRPGRSALSDLDRSIVNTSLGSLEKLTTTEVTLVRDNGGDEPDLVERHRIERIKATIGDMFAQSATGTATGSTVEIYRARLKPLLDEAIDNERGEVQAVGREMEALKTQMSWKSSAGILLEILTVGLVLSLVVRRVLDPVKRLVADIGELGRGHLAHRVPVARRDELGVLALNVNRMARQLQRGRQRLIEMNDSLEKIVADRTQALQARNEELHEIDESRRRFFVDVSHELRTPLTAIVGEADVTLRDGRADIAACRSALLSILANSTFLNRRIDDLMALACSVNGQLGLHQELFDLNIVAADAMAEIRSLAKVNQLTTRFEPLFHPLHVEGDRFRIRQCLMILLDNAVKFSRANGVVETSLTATSAEARVTVSNQGSGIAAQDLPAIFERFYQTEVGRRKGGTGLGLAIARRIVEAHNGAITATSDALGKTAVTISLPLLPGVTA